MTTRCLLASLVLIVVGACGNQQTPSAAQADGMNQVPPPTVASPSGDRAVEESKILESVFRRLIEHGGAIPAPLEKTWFLSIRGKDPSAAFLLKFSGYAQPVKMGSQWHQGRGVLLFATEVNWLDDHTVEVLGGNNPGYMSAAGLRFHVIWKDGAWTVTEVTREWIE